MISKRSLISAVFFLVILFQLVRFIPASYIIDSSARFRAYFQSKPRTLTHPIPKLIANAEANYRRLLARQSQSLRNAVAEYRRRYKRDPPKGFDEWYAFAKDNNVKIIDEYNGMVDDLAPFWDLSGEEIRRRVLQVSSAFSSV